MPVRGGLGAKTRLTSVEGRDLTEEQRARLAAAMSADTVAAAVASGVGQVHVLTGDGPVREMAGLLGAQVRDDHGTGLNSELIRATTELGACSPVAVLLGDLPTLTPQDLRQALAAALEGDPPGCFVADWEGTGTALVALPVAVTPMPLAFGPGSARRHRDRGLRSIGTELIRLRTDVDTPQAWSRAVSLGLGPATSTLRAELLAQVSDPQGPRLTVMAQGSVHTFEPSSGAGSVLLDDGQEVPFSAEAFEASGLRLLRSGQRVSLDRDDDGTITRVFIRGIGDGETIA